MTLTRRVTMLSLAGAAGLGASSEALAQPAVLSGWPSRPLRIVVTFAPGGSTDLVARLVAQGLQDQLGQPVVVENRAGAGGTTATGHVARSAPDGYTLVLSSSTVMAIGPALYRSVQYDAMRDFVHVALLTTNHLVFAANPRFAARDLADLVRLSQAAPGGLDMASSGAGSLNHMLIVHFANTAGARLNHIAYRGAGPAMAAVIGGEVPLMSDSLPSASAHIRQGAVRALGIPGDRRSEQFPDVPTFREQGVDIVSLGWFGLAAPAGTPPGIVERLNREVRAVLATPHVRARLAEFDATPGDMSVAAFTELVRADHERWGPMVRASGASAE
jgi:tripartite-type tricarboxylate transporter receptor subunit TctC